MSVAVDGTLACAWLDLRGKGTRLYMASLRTEARAGLTIASSMPRPAARSANAATPL